MAKGMEQLGSAQETLRAFERSDVELTVKIRRPGENWFVSQITNMSCSGFRLQSFMHMRVGSEIWVMLPGFDGRRARVSWAEGHQAGCAFERPLHPAIYDHVIRQGLQQRG